MKERPILMSAPMIRATLAGTKTQTRRAIRPQHDEQIDPVFFDGAWQWATLESRRVCPYGVPGDRLWVRETWTWNGGQGDRKPGEFAKLWVTYAADGEKREIAPGGVVPLPKQPPQLEGEVYSLRDAPEDFRYDGENTYVDRLHRWWGRKIPAIHMFRWASRISLEVTGIRVERLQDISEADAKAEGIVAQPGGGFGLADGSHYHGASARISYWSLWDAINGAGSVDANPWVWAVAWPRL